MKKHFKRPLKVTAIVFPLMLVIGIIGVTMIHQSGDSNRKKMQRASMLGSGVATMGCIIIAPFWLIAAARIGAERREAMGKK